MTSTANPGPDPDQHRRVRAGVGFGFGAYAIWGLLPLYFVLLAPAGPYEIVALRVLFSLVFCLLILAITRGLRQLLRVFRDGHTLAALSVAGVLIAANWLLYTVATTTGHTLEASLGYFINPLVAILLGVVVLHEKLRALQWAALGVGVLAVLVMAVFYGSVPWLSLGLAFSFGFYGLVKSRIGSRYPALVTLTAETATITPLALVAVALLGVRGEVTLTSEGPGHFLLLLAAGVITAVPLLLFGAAASRLPLSTLGMIQYVAPIGQFVLAVALFHEAMPPGALGGLRPRVDRGGAARARRRPRTPGAAPPEAPARHPRLTRRRRTPLPRHGHTAGLQMTTLRCRSATDACRREGTSTPRSAPPEGRAETSPPPDRVVRGWAALSAPGMPRRRAAGADHRDPRPTTVSLGARGRRRPRAPGRRRRAASSSPPRARGAAGCPGSARDRPARPPALGSA